MSDTLFENLGRKRRVTYYHWMIVVFRSINYIISKCRSSLARTICSANFLIRCVLEKFIPNYRIIASQPPRKSSPSATSSENICLLPKMSILMFGHIIVQILEFQSLIWDFPGLTSFAAHAGIGWIDGFFRMTARNPTTVPRDRWKKYCAGSAFQ